MDIGSREGFPAGDLSNFSPFTFFFDGVQCDSMEGLLQSLKTSEIQIQLEICKLVGINAKKRGRKFDKFWKNDQKLWWLGQVFDRHSEEFQKLLDRAFGALSTNTEFQKALLATGDEILTHSIGKSDKHDTVLTEDEFCSRLMKTREVLRKEKLEELCVINR